jgi:hypothetical protein
VRAISSFGINNLFGLPPKFRNIDDRQAVAFWQVLPQDVNHNIRYLASKSIIKIVAEIFKP